jgi:hypothetical protein
MDEKKNEIAKRMMNIEYYPATVEQHVSPEEYTKLPLSNISALGVAFEPLTVAFKNVFSGGAATSGIYKVTVPNGMYLAARTDGSGFLGSSLSTVTNKVAGQATLNPLLFEPTMLFMAVALANINKKLDGIQDMQRELLDFLTQKERSQIKGDLSFLTDVINNYKYNCNNDKYKNSNHIKVLDIMQSAERKIDFYREMVLSKLKKKSLFHSDQDVRKQLAQMQSNFKDYQISLYLFSFSSFLQVMLLENFDCAYLDGVTKKLEDYSYEYRDLYSKTYTQIERIADSSIQSSFLKGWASATKVTGEALSKVPIISKTQIDESLIERGEKLSETASKRTKQTMEQFLEKQSAYVRPFIENINTVNRLYNQPLEILFDAENLYIGAG